MDDRKLLWKYCGNQLFKKVFGVVVVIMLSVSLFCPPVMAEQKENSKASGTGADHNGFVTTDDSLKINQHTAGVGKINQNYTITEVPDDCYYLDPVIF